jgi:hypothetical protein
MKVLIQLTFNNGLGNLYCGATELLNFATECKKMGYSCELIFASNHGVDNKYINYIDFEEIFDISSFQVFDKITSIEQSIKDKKYNEYYFFAACNVKDPGQHWWDIFLTDTTLNLPDKPQYDIHTLYNQKVLPKILPKFSTKIYEKVESFKSKISDVKKCIQVRHNDYTLNVDDEFTNYTSSIIEIIKDNSEKFYISSNNKFFLDNLNKLDNTVIYSFNNLDLFSNDHSYHYYNRTINREILLERLIDNICEMIILSEFEVIFHHSSIGWQSTFLYYSLSHNKNQKLININWRDNLKNLNLW